MIEFRLNGASKRKFKSLRDENKNFIHSFADDHHTELAIGKMFKLGREGLHEGPLADDCMGLTSQRDFSFLLPLK